MKITDGQVEFIIERLKEGKQEAELGYFGRERDNIITETVAVPLQMVKSFEEIKIIKMNKFTGGWK